MPITRVKLPDGTVIRLQVPEGATPEQIREFAKKHVAEQKLIAKLLAKIPKPKDGEDGEDGLSIKGDKGDDGEDGTNGIDGINGEDGEDGVSIVNVQLNKKKELITTLSNGKKINAGKITEKLASDVFEVFYTNPLKNTTNLGSNIGDLIAFNGKSWDEVAVGNTGTQYLAPNNADPLGVSWQDKGFSYLTDELGNALTDELGNALEGKDAVDARLLVNNDPEFIELTFADSPYTATRSDTRKTIIDVDCTDGVVIITLYPMIKFDQIDIKKTDSSGNKLTYKGDGFNIDDLTERDISTQYNNDRIVGGITQWQRR